MAPLAAALLAALALATCMGFLRSNKPPRAALPADDLPLRERLERSVRVLSEQIGERNMGRPAALEAAALFVEEELGQTGRVERQEFSVGGQKVRNLELSLPGTTRAEELVVIGAHYDSVIGTPGADDNATGVAALIELGRLLAQRRHERSLRLVAFVNEEPPHFQTADMGSLVYARALRARGARVHAMLSLESLGYFSDQKGSQSYPMGLGLVYPTTGNFMGIVGDRSSSEVVEAVARAFRDAGRIPFEKAALPGSIPGVGWSDQWSFWQAGYPGVMITDTAPFRNPHYHQRSDLPDTLDFDRLTHTVRALEVAVEALAVPAR